MSFNGFPSKDLRFISIPDLFFTQLVPAIDDLAELKITLHILWLHTRQHHDVIARADLLADETLMTSLSQLPDETPIVTVLHDGLMRAVRRGTLLQAQVTDDTGTHDLYILNSGRGRQAYEKIQSGELHVMVKPEAEPALPIKRKNIFALYEENIGLITPLLVDQLKEAEELYPAEWIEEAFQIAVERNVRHWKYIRAILERRAAGNSSDNKGDDGAVKSWYNDDEFSTIIQH